MQVDSFSIDFILGFFIEGYDSIPRISPDFWTINN